MQSKPIPSDSPTLGSRVTLSAPTEQISSVEGSGVDSANISNNNSANPDRREKIFSSALSSQEKELLKKIFNSPTKKEKEPISYGSDAGSSSISQEASFTKPASLEMQLAELIRSYKASLNNPVSEVDLALKILRALVSERENTSASPDSKDKRLLLAELLRTIASERNEDNKVAEGSEILNQIKQQSQLSPEQRGSLLQSVVPASQEESLLLENFILRRDEIISAKSDILALIEKMNAAISKTPAQTAKIPDENLSELLSRYLSMLISDNTATLEQINKTVSSRNLMLLFLQFQSPADFRYADFPANETNRSSDYPGLVAALKMSALVGKLSKLQTGIEGTSDQILTQSLRALISEALSKKSESLNQATELNESAHFAHQELLLAMPTDGLGISQALGPTEKRSSAQILENLIKKLDFNSSLDESEYLRAKLLEHTPKARSLLLKLEKLIDQIDLPTQIQIIPAISLGALELAITVRSPDIFNATIQFLRSSASGKDLISSLSALLLPFLNSLQVSLNNEQPELNRELRATIEQIEIIKNTARNSQKRKDSLLREVRTASGIFDRLLSDSEILGIYDKLLAESVGKETLNRLNSLAERLGQPKTTNLFLQPTPNQSGLELTTLNAPDNQVEPDTQSTKREKKRSAIEKIECSMLLPSIGECGIAISIWENKISLTICNRNRDAVEQGLTLLPKLEQRLVQMEFEAPQLAMLCAEPKPVKPEWLMQILGSTQI